MVSDRYQNTSEYGWDKTHREKGSFVGVRGSDTVEFEFPVVAREVRGSCYQLFA